MRSLERRLATAPRKPWPQEPVPIVLAITELDVGGAEKALVSLATRLERTRWAPHVVCLGPEAELVSPLREAGLPVTCLNARPARPVQGIGRLIRTLRQVRPALIQSFLFHANIAVRLAAPFAGRPWVVSGLRVAEHGKRWHRVLDRFTSRCSVGSVCVSEGVRRFSVQRAGLAPERLAVIPNGIDVTRFDTFKPVVRSDLGVPDRGHLALFVGRIDAQKGVGFLLSAAKIVLRERPDWYLAIVGDGPEIAASRRLVAGDPLLAGHVRWLGRRDDVPGLLATADLLVSASLWEGMPNAVLEAMAARKAVVGTSVEGTEELVLPGRTGWLVPPADPAALAAALGEAASDPDRLRRFGLEGRARVEANYSLDRVVAAYNELWGGILGYDPKALNISAFESRR